MTVAVVTGVLDSVADVQEWTSSVEAWPAGSHVWGHYAERTPAGEAICRTENVSACHPGFASLVDGVLRNVVSEGAGEDMAAFKDKINYKQPGGAGFSPHQDLVAYPGAPRVLSVLVAIDPCTEESGCLWLADGVSSVLPVDERGVVADSSALRWEPAPLAAGDAVLIDGLAPHYSEANRSDAARRVLVVSYAPASSGYGRSEYYEARRATMDRASAADGRWRISTLADFEGEEVPVRAPAAAAGCTHR